jgi:hypothetical protein
MYCNVLLDVIRECSVPRFGRLPRSARQVMSASIWAISDENGDFFWRHAIRARSGQVKEPEITMLVRNHA